MIDLTRINRFIDVRMTNFLFPHNIPNDSEIDDTNLDDLTNPFHALMTNI